MNQGMGVTVDGGQPNWEKGVVGMSAMCSSHATHALVRGGCYRGKIMCVEARE